MEIAPMEIFDLITQSRNTIKNRRMFEYYNYLSGRSKPLKPCFCASKVAMIKEFLSNYLKETGFLNGTEQA